MEQCLTTARGKTWNKNLRAKQAKSWTKISFFCHFFKFGSLVFLDITQDFSLGQCVASSRAETSNKNFVAQIGAEMIFSILISSSVHSNLLFWFNIFISICKELACIWVSLHFRNLSENQLKSLSIFLLSTVFPLINVGPQISAAL